MTISHSLLSATFGTVSYTGWGRSSLQFSVLRYFKTTVWLESPPSPKWIIAHSFLLNNQDLQMSTYSQSDTFLHCSLTYKEKVVSLQDGLWENPSNCTVSLLGHMSANSHSWCCDLLFTHRHKQMEMTRLVLFCVHCSICCVLIESHSVHV